LAPGQEKNEDISSHPVSCSLFRSGS